MLAFVEAFWLMGVVFLLMIPLLPLLQYSKAKRPSGAVPKLQEQSPPPDIPESWSEAFPEEAVKEEHDLVLH